MPLDADDLIRIIEELDDAWISYKNTGKLRQPHARSGQKIEGEDILRMTTVRGWADHAFELSRSIRKLYCEGLHTSMFPLVRLAYELSLSGVWLMQSEKHHGVNAFVLNYTRSRTNLKNDAEGAASLSFREAAEQFVANIPEDVGPTVDKTRFQQICEDLGSGTTDAYLYYRMLSEYCHPSFRVSDLYCDKAVMDKGDEVAFLETPSLGYPSHHLLYFTAIALVWISAAYQYVSNDKTHRSLIRKAGRELEVEVHLQLSESYRLRHIKAKKEVKRTTGSQRAAKSRTGTRSE